MKAFWLVLSLFLSGAFAGLAQPKTDSAPAATNETEVLSAIQLERRPLDEVLRLYAHLANRSVLQHPDLLAVPRISLSITNGTRERQVELMEDGLRREGIAVIRDGVRFALVVPVGLTNRVSAKSEAAAKSSDPRTEQVIPAGLLDMRGMPFGDFARIYSEYRGFQPGRVPGSGPFVTFRSQTSLTRGELIYALDTLIEWHGFAVVTNAAGGLDIIRASEAR